MLTLQPDLDKLEGNNDKGLGGTSSCACENGERLSHLGDTEQVPVVLAPLIVGSELGGTLGSLHEDGGRDTAVETRSAGLVSVACSHVECPFMHTPRSSQSS